MEKRQDLISRQGIIDVLSQYPFEKVVNCISTIEEFPSAQAEQSSEIQDILDYLDTVLHPIISPEHWNVYSELHDMISSLPSAQPTQSNDSNTLNALDCISRAEAIDTIMSHATKVLEHCDDYFFRDIYKMAHRHIAELIELLPSAQPNWISLEDKLPNNNECVLLQFKTNMSVGFFEDGDWVINTGDGIYTIGWYEEKPVAWMPLPEPYKERRER